MGIPPAVEVTISNINDNIDRDFLAEIVSKYGQVEELYIYYHPVTKKHLGLARVVFDNPAHAKLCVQKLNGTSVMGQKLLVFLDAFGEDQFSSPCIFCQKNTFAECKMLYL